MKSLFSKHKSLLLITLIVGGVLLLAKPVAASWAAEVLASLLSVIISAIGYIIGLVIEALIYVAQYNDFTKAPPIVRGWVVVRDLSNMFFVLVMLIISFATILHIESYSYKKYLPKLLIMAILINFSKTIAGLLIDFAQVIMLTFVNGFKDIGAGNLTYMLGLKEVLDVKDGVEPNFWTIAAAYILGLVYVIISLVIVTAMLATLVMRIVMLWVYVVLSPLAFLLGAFPGGQKYFSQWWGGFSKEVIIGPVLAFFIWLSFVSVTITSDSQDILPVDNFESSEDQATNLNNISGEAAGTGDGIPTEAADPDVFIRFIVSIGLLMGGLMISKQIGAGAGQAMNKTVSSFQKGGRSIGRASRRGLIKAGKGLKTLGGDIRDKASHGLGVDLNYMNAIRRINREGSQRRQDRKSRIASKTIGRAAKGDRFAALMHGGIFWKNFKEGRYFKGQKGIAEAEKTMNTKKQEYEDIVKTRQSVISASEQENRDKEVEEKETERIEKQKRLDVLEKQGKLTPEEKDEQADLTAELTNLEAEIKVLNDKEVVEDKEYQEIVEKEKKAESDFLGSQKNYNDLYQKKAWVGTDTARIEAQQEIDADSLKVIANIDGQEQLTRVLLEAIAIQNQSLARVTFKKLAKTSNYNEPLKALGLGTGYDGLKTFSDEYLMKRGGFSQDEAVSLLSEVGELAKGVHHYSAFGMATNENGKWRYSTPQEYQAAQLAEMSKVQIQKLVRDMTRLGAGHYKGGVHNAENFVLHDSTALGFASKDQAFHDEMKKTGNMNLILHIGGREKNMQKLLDAGAVKVHALVKSLLARAKAAEAGGIAVNPEQAISDFQAKYPPEERTKKTK